MEVQIRVRDHDHKNENKPPSVGEHIAIVHGRWVDPTPPARSRCVQVFRVRKETGDDRQHPERCYNQRGFAVGPLVEAARADDGDDRDHRDAEDGDVDGLHGELHDDANNATGGAAGVMACREKIYLVEAADGAVHGVCRFCQL